MTHIKSVCHNYTFWKSYQTQQTGKANSYYQPIYEQNDDFSINFYQNNLYTNHSNQIFSVSVLLKFSHCIFITLYRNKVLHYKNIFLYIIQISFFLNNAFYRFQIILHEKYLSTPLNCLIINSKKLITWRPPSLSELTSL